MSVREIERGLLQNHDPIQKKGRYATGKEEIPCLVAIEEAGAVVGSDDSQPESPALGERPRVVESPVDDVLKQEVHQLLFELLGISLCSRNFGRPGARKLSNCQPSLRAKQDRHAKSAPQPTWFA